MPDTLNNIRHRLNPAPEKQYRSKGRIDKVLSRRHINMIPMTDPIQLTSSTTTNSPASKLAPLDLQSTPAKKRPYPRNDRTTSTSIRLQKPSFSASTPDTQKPINAIGFKSSPKSKNKIGCNKSPEPPWKNRMKTYQEHQPSKQAKQAK